MAISKTNDLLRLNLPFLTQPTWLDDVNNNFKTIGAVFSSYIVLRQLQGVWTNGTQYLVNDTVVDSVSGNLFTANLTHTSAASGTFAADRATNPTFWRNSTLSAVARGAWATATTYYPGDFVVSGNIYAVCVTQHVSGATFAGDVANWAYLVDLTAAVTSINASVTAAGTSATNSANSATASATSATNSANSATASAASAAASAAGAVIATVTLASASSVAIGAAASTNVKITGTTTISAFDSFTEGALRQVVAAGSFTLTHNATSLILFGSNISVVSGDSFLMKSLGGGNWKCVEYQRLDGTAVTSGGTTPVDITGAAAIGVAHKSKDVRWSGAAGSPVLTAGATMGSCSLGFQNTNDGKTNTGAALLTASGADTIDGRASIYVYPSESFSLDGDGATPTAWTTRGRARKGARVLIQEQALAAVASADFTLGFSDTELLDMEFEIVGLNTSAVQFSLRISIAGTFQTAANYGYGGLTMSTNISTGAGATNSFSSATGTSGLTHILSAAYASVHGLVILNDFKNVSTLKNMRVSTVSYDPGSGFLYECIGYVSWLGSSSAAAVDGLRFLVSSGTFSATAIRQKGVRE